MKRFDDGSIIMDISVLQIIRSNKSKKIVISKEVPPRSNMGLWC